MERTYISADGDSLHVRGFRLAPSLGRILDVDLREEFQEGVEGEQATKDALCGCQWYHYLVLR